MKQELVEGTRVVHMEFGEGVVKEIHPQRFLPYLVQFDNENDRLHNSCGYAKGCYPNKHMYWFDVSELVPVKVIVTPKTESQQLVDILVQLGFNEPNIRYIMEGSQETIEEKIMRYSRYSRALNKKIAQTPKQVPPTQELVIHIPDNVGRVKLVTNLSNLVIEVDNKGVQSCKNL